MRFRTALMIGTTVLFGTVGVALLAGVGRAVTRHAEESIDRDLARSRKVVAELWRQREALFRAQSQRLADEPRLRAVAATQDIDTATAVDVARDVRRASDADLFLLVDQHGQLLADTRHPQGGGAALGQLPIVRHTLEKGRASGVVASDDDVYQVHGCSMRFGQVTVGAVLIGHRIGEHLVKALEEQTGAQVAIVFDGAQVAVSRELIAAGLGQEALAVLQAKDQKSGAKRLTLGEARYVASTVDVSHDSQGRELSFVLLRSLDEAMLIARRLESVVALVAGSALIASILLAVFLSRRLSGPLDELVGVVGKLGSGDLTARADGSTLHETRTLALAMNKMAGELLDSRRQIEEKQRLEQEMKVATVLQTTMLPSDLRAARLEIAARMTPASEVGGDYYDVIPVGESCWIGIGDVTGHGLPAGIVMMMVQTAVAALVRSDAAQSPASVVSALNALIYHNVHERLRSNEHVTFTLFRHDGRGGFCFAGAHETFLVYRRESGSYERCATPGTWLAIVDDVRARTQDTSIQLEPGDAIVLYTDGVTEAASADGQLFGLARLESSLRELGSLSRHASDGVLDHIFNAVTTWSSSQDDDRTVVVIRYLGDAETRQSRRFKVTRP